MRYCFLFLVLRRQRPQASLANWETSAVFSLPIKLTLLLVGIDLRHYESGNYLAQEHITKRGNPYARKILFKCIHNIASASHTNPCHIANFYEKRKRQSNVDSTKPHTIASIHHLIRTLYYLITHNKLYNYHLAINQ